MKSVNPANWVYAEGFQPSTDIEERARGRAEELGCTPVSAAVASLLRVLAAATGAKHVVEIGTGTGVSGLALLTGMGDDGILTSIDIQPEHQHAARECFAESGIRGNRIRLINGSAGDVLPRLADRTYDLVLVDADKTEIVAYVEQAVRILRPGGTLVVDNALWKGRVADPAQRDEQTTQIRRVGQLVRDDDALVSVLLPVGDGVLVATKR